MSSCNSCQYLGKILAKIFPRSWQDLAKILLRYPWRVDPGSVLGPATFEHCLKKFCKCQGRTNVLQFNKFMKHKVEWPGDGLKKKASMQHPKLSLKY